MLRLQELRKRDGLSQQQLAGLLGVTQATLSGWENEKYEIDNKSLIKCANIFHVSVDYLLGNEEPSKSAIKIPVLGTVAAGIPLEAIEEILDWEEIPVEMARQGEFFGLVIHGDSMSPRFLEGDVVIVRKQETADSGDIVIAKVNGDDACCKKLVRHEEGLSLVSLNSAYAPMFFSKNEVFQKPVTIIGKVVELRGKM